MSMSNDEKITLKKVQSIESEIKKDGLVIYLVVMIICGCAVGMAWLACASQHQGCL